MLTLPKGMNFTSYDYLAMYCTRFNHNFGYVQLLRNVDVEKMEPMVTKKLPKPCPQDHLEDEDEEEDEEDEERRRKRRKISINKRKINKLNV